MTRSETVQLALIRARMSQRQLALKMNTTPQNLNQKIRRNTLNDGEMQKIADILGCNWEKEKLEE